MIRIFLLDDHDGVREGVQASLDAEEDMTVVGAIGTADAALTTVASCRPDVAVLDFLLADGNGIDVCRQITSDFPRVKSLIFTSFNSDQALIDAGRAGAVGFVLKQIRGTGLTDAIRLVASGRLLIDEHAIRMARQRLGLTDIV